ncbi:MAG TPA: V-type ATP synthase subunit D [Candidatus Cloacimonadota bacterium]|nr:V-type ATP synthase subunit D [Candidatus Cloacimonadota bacterium]HOV16883.1 V-type ATP synthase subunit D [Candidatus Cloacimonadota bacterium]HQL14129.1 V-type ATP synthase subunit D [Candidatus Cloacimonadota bacterium]
MEVKFQYNKTSLQELNKQLQVRLRALPTLKNKESALRMEVQKAKDAAADLEAQVEARTQELSKYMRFWQEFDPSLVSIKEVEIITRKIAGVKIPIMGKIEYDIKPYFMFYAPAWYLDGIKMLQSVSALKIERQFYLRKMKILDGVRKKTTQKVNLYEKVQIPGFEDAIRKIKRFLEDEENLSKSSQKILKSRLEAEEAV